MSSFSQREPPGFNSSPIGNATQGLGTLRAEALRILKLELGVFVREVLAQKSEGGKLAVYGSSSLYNDTSTALTLLAPHPQSDIDVAISEEREHLLSSLAATYQREVATRHNMEMWCMKEGARCAPTEFRLNGEILFRQTHTLKEAEAILDRYERGHLAAAFNSDEKITTEICISFQDDTLQLLPLVPLGNDNLPESQNGVLYRQHYFDVASGLLSRILCGNSKRTDLVTLFNLLHLARDQILKQDEVELKTFRLLFLAKLASHYGLHSNFRSLTTFPIREALSHLREKHPSHPETVEWFVDTTQSDSFRYGALTDRLLWGVSDILSHLFAPALGMHTSPLSYFESTTFEPLLTPEENAFFQSIVTSESRNGPPRVSVELLESNYRKVFQHYPALPARMRNLLQELALQAWISRI